MDGICAILGRTPPLFRWTGDLAGMLAAVMVWRSGHAEGKLTRAWAVGRLSAGRSIILSPSLCRQQRFHSGPLLASFSHDLCFALGWLGYVSPFSMLIGFIALVQRAASAGIAAANGQR